MIDFTNIFAEFIIGKPVNAGFTAHLKLLPGLCLLHIRNCAKV